MATKKGDRGSKDDGFAMREAELQAEEAEEAALIDGRDNSDAVFIELAAKTRNGRETVRPFEFADRETGEMVQRVEITLPQGTLLANNRDVSFYSFTASPRQVDPGGQRRYNRHTVLKSSVDMNSGEEAEIELRRDFGGRDSSGTWHQDIDIVKVKPEALKDACMQQITRENQYQKRISEKYAEEKAAEQAQASPEAPATSEALNAGQTQKTTKVQKAKSKAATPKADKTLAAASSKARNKTNPAPAVQKQAAKALA